MGAQERGGSWQLWTGARGWCVCVCGGEGGYRAAVIGTAGGRIEPSSSRYSFLLSAQTSLSDTGSVSERATPPTTAHGSRSVYATRAHQITRGGSGVG